MNDIYHHTIKYGFFFSIISKKKRLKLLMEEFYQYFIASTDDRNVNFQRSINYFIELRNENPQLMVINFLELLKTEIPNDVKLKIIKTLPVPLKGRTGVNLEKNLNKFDYSVIQDAIDVLLPFLSVEELNIGVSTSKTIGIFLFFFRSIYSPTSVVSYFFDQFKKPISDYHAENLFAMMSSLVISLKCDVFSQNLDFSTTLCQLLINYFKNDTTLEMKKYFVYLAYHIIVKSFQKLDYFPTLVTMIYNYTEFIPKKVAYAIRNILFDNFSYMELLPQMPEYFLSLISKDCKKYYILITVLNTEYYVWNNNGSDLYSNSSYVKCEVMSSCSDQIFKACVDMLQIGPGKIDLNDSCNISISSVAAKTLLSLASVVDMNQVYFNFVVENVNDNNLIMKYVCGVIFFILLHYLKTPSDNHSKGDDHADDFFDNAISLLNQNIYSFFQYGDQNLSYIALCIFANAINNNVIESLPFIETVTKIIEYSDSCDIIVECLNSVQRICIKIPSDVKLQLFNFLLVYSQKDLSEEVLVSVFETISTFCNMDSDILVQFVPNLFEACQYFSGNSLIIGKCLYSLTALLPKYSDSEEYINNLLDLGKKLFDNNNENDGLYVLSAVASITSNPEIYNSILPKVLEMFNDPNNDDDLKISISILNIIVPCITDQELIVNIYQRLIDFYDDIYVRKKLGIELIAYLIGIANYHTFLVHQYIDFFKNLVQERFIYIYRPCFNLLLALTEHFEDGSNNPCLDRWFHMTVSFDKIRRLDSQVLINILKVYKLKCPDSFDRKIVHCGFIAEFLRSALSEEELVEVMS